jgi:predicted transcriptional regulator
MKARTSDVNIEKDKLEIIKWVTTLKDVTSIERLKMLKDSRSKTDWWNQISDEEQNAIDKGLTDIKAGRLKPHKEVKKLYKKWL